MCQLESSIPLSLHCFHARVFIKRNAAGCAIMTGTPLNAIAAPCGATHVCPELVYPLCSLVRVVLS